MPNFQSSVFTNEEKNRANITTGFFTEKVETTDISDGDTALSRAAINKMCTSIPSPFARMFLFRTAFKEVTRREEQNPMINAHRENRLYNYLVSDCLDMLEFIFYYGGEREFNVINWNRNTELNMLHSNAPNWIPNIKHKRLKSALESEFQAGSPFGNVNIISLFTWNDNPEDPNSRAVVIGGTSPFSLVYTSPNWIREKNNKGWAFSAGNAGANLFDNDPQALTHPKSLVERSPRFRKFIYKLWFAYRGHNPSLGDFERYIDQSWTRYDHDRLEMADIAGLAGGMYTSAMFCQEYGEKLNCVVFGANGNAEFIETDVIVVGSGGAAHGIPLRCNPSAALQVNGDYMIDLPVDDAMLPEESTGINAPVQIERPLVLDPNIEIAGCCYIEDASWGEYSGSMPAYNAENPNYWERTLPGTTRKYPYLRIEDFLEEKIIRLASYVSGKHFLTGNVRGQITYLPPLKRTFFKFFKLNDLFHVNNAGAIELDENGYPRTRPDVFSMSVSDDGSVVVTLNIPVRGGIMTLSKTYAYNADPDHSDIINFSDILGDRAFNLSVFPFYQLTGAGSEYNKYSLMLGYLGDVSLHFYGEDLNRELGGNVVKVKERTDSNQIKTRYYTIDEAFDLIEIEACGAKGIVVPLFKRIRPGNTSYVFCVDFGTTNTHVAWGIDNGGMVSQVQDFAYDETDEQVVNLYEPGGYMHYRTSFKREFVPERIASSPGDAEEVPSFPIRTTACASTNWLGDPQAADCHLFGDANVGFFFLNEEPAMQNGSNHYVPDIKWARGTKSGQLRQAYFDELMWMIKNKAVLNGGSMDFYFYFTYPQSMQGNAVGSLYNLWRNARNNVRAGDPNQFNMNPNALVHPVEGIAPWFAGRKDGIISAADTYLNIDIGGGTMDMVYQNPKDKENFCYSARFAADDLWGDGIDQMADNRMNNAFIRDYTQGDYFPMANALVDRYNAFKANAKTSADLISFLFKYNDQYHFHEYLQESQLITLVLMHFVANAYYVGLVLNKDGLNVPRKIGFTGMGSLYIGIISPIENDIAELFKSVLRYQGFTDDEVKNLQVVLRENPKVVTAQGGVVFHRPGTGDLTHISQVESYVWGFDGEDVDADLRERDAVLKKEAVLKLTEDYIGYFESEEFRKTRDKLNRGWNMAEINKNSVMNLAENSFNDWYTANYVAPDSDVLKDPLFFWPIKGMLYKYGLEIIE